MQIAECGLRHSDLLQAQVALALSHFALCTLRNRAGIEGGVGVGWGVSTQLCRMREKLIAEILWFVPRVAKLSGVRRVALLGSITTHKKDPKDIDFLVTVTDVADLEPLAKLGRQVKGHAQQFNHGADVFLTDQRGQYIGRTCSWRSCATRIRRACDALHCGRRHYLHDDLATVTLSREAMNGAVGLWPKVELRAALPEDVLSVLESLQSL
jgi:hypothetical protein